MGLFTALMHYEVSQLEGKGGFVVFSSGGPEYHPESDRETYKGGGLICDVPGPGQILEDYNTWSSQHEEAFYAASQARGAEDRRRLQEGTYGRDLNAPEQPDAPTGAEQRAAYLKLRKEMIDLETSETPEQFAARCATPKEESPLDVLHRHQEEWAAAASAKSDAANKAEVDREAGAAAHIAQLEHELGIKK